jgi:tetratricopeptide (TPR) repeat protein
LLLALPVGAAPAGDIAALVARARAGDALGSARLMLDWPPDRITASAQELDDCEGPCLRAAALLYTEVAARHMFSSDRKTRSAAHDVAERLAAEVGDPGFERRRVLALGYWCQQWGKLNEAHEYYEKYPDAPESLLAQGSLHEQMHALGSEGGHLVAVPGPLAKAAEWYERALAARPGYAEARLRLARVRQLQGRRAQAREALAALVRDASGPLVAGYAHLFLGEIEQDEKRLDSALAELRRAVAANPRLQPAHLSLSQALHQSGRVREAAQAMLDGLRATADGNVDGWYGYHSVVLHGFHSSMQELWAEVRE